MPFNTAEATAITTVTLVSASLSFLGSLFIIVTYLALPRVQRFSYRVIAWLSVADCFSSLSYFIHDPTPFVALQEPFSASCLISAGLSQLMDVATFCWTVAVSTTVYLVLIRRASPQTLQLAERLFHGINWGVPLLMMIIAASVGSFGDAGTWCWIRPEFQALRMLLFYVPLMVCMLAVFGVVLLMRRDIEASTSLKPEQKPLVLRRMYIFCAVFFILRIFSIVNRMQQLAASPGSEPVFALSLLHATFSPLQGFANSLVYGLNRLVVTEYSLVWARCRGREAVSGHGERADREARPSGVGSGISIAPTSELEAMGPASRRGGVLNPMAAWRGVAASQGRPNKQEAAGTADSAEDVGSPIALELFGSLPAPLQARGSFINPVRSSTGMMDEPPGEIDASRGPAVQPSLGMAK